MRLNYLLIPLAALAAALTSSALAERQLEWYASLNLPAYLPSGTVVAALWSLLLVPVMLSVLIVWNTFHRDEKFHTVMWIFLLNIGLNLYWSYLFFSQHNLSGAFWEALALLLSSLLLVYLIHPRSRLASLLLWPYAVWIALIACASYLIK